MFRGLTKKQEYGILVQKLRQEDYEMMHAVDNLNIVGCSVGSAVFSDASLMQSISAFASPEYVIFPGFCDVHVHFR